jgi:type I restriction enzyme S subunit
MSLKPYPAYKDSGVVWLDKLPDEWAVKRIKHNTYLKGRVGWKGLTSDEFLQDSDAYLVTGTDFNGKYIEWSECYQVERARYDDDPFIQLQEGDLLITKDGTIGKLALVKQLDKPACLNSGIFLIRPKSDYKTPFMYWVLQSESFKTFVDLSSTGSTILHLYQNVFDEFAFPVPSPSEQTVIAGFLDRETGKIDQLIAEQEKLIALLAEKRQATILYAVTKGLNPAAPLKHSGLDWLGQIPAHWTACAARRIVRKIEQGWSPECENRPAEISEWGVLKTGCVNRGVFVAIENKALPAPLEPLPEYEVQAGDILMSRASGSRELIGSVAYVFDVRPGLMLSDKIFRLRLDEAVDSRFFVYLFNSVALREQIVLAISGAEGLANNLPQSEIRSFAVSVPPKAEQRQIVKFLDSELAKLTSLNQEAARVIDILKERRAALISAAVTGKIDVRQRSAEIIDLAVARRRLRGLLAVELIEKSQGRATFGRTALQKHAYLAEAFAGIYELGGRYVRNDYGPLDRDMIDDMEGEAQALCGIVTQLPTGPNRSVTYLLSRPTGTLSNELLQQLGPERGAKLQRLHALLAPLNTHEVEGVATLFAVWSGFMIEKKDFGDDDIVNGFLNDWHPRKSENFNAHELHLRLKWMRDHHLVPTGAGPKTETGRLFV